MDLPGRLQSELGSAYRIERPLGRGGMATGCFAPDLRPACIVASNVTEPQ